MLALAWIAGFTLIDSAIVSLALPDIARDFERSIGELAWVSSGFLLALAASLLAAGRLGDLFGPRTMMAAGAIGFGLTTLACGLAPSFEILVAARVAQGVAGGVLYTVSLAIAATAFPPERRATAISIYFTSGALSAVVGPVIGGWLTDLGGWRTVFLAQLPIPILVLLLTLAVLPRSAVRMVSFDLPGVASASVFIAASTFAILQLAVPGGQIAALIVGAVALAALGAFVFFESRSIQPAVRLSIFRNARFVIGSLAGAGAWFAIMSQQVYVAIYLQLGRGFDATLSGVLLLAAPLVALVLFPAMGALVTRFGVERPLLIGLALMLVGGGAMLTWTSDSDELWIFGVLLASGLGIAITLVASATEALSQFGPAEAATGSAVFNSIRQLGAALGVAMPAVAFEIVAQGSRTPDATLGGSAAAFLLRTLVLSIPLVAVLLVASSPASRFLRRRVRRQAGDNGPIRPASARPASRRP